MLAVWHRASNREKAPITSWADQGGKRQLAREGL